MPDSSACAPKFFSALPAFISKRLLPPAINGGRSRGA